MWMTIRGALLVLTGLGLLAMGYQSGGAITVGLGIFVLL